MAPVDKTIARAVSIRDLRDLARRRLPKAIFDFIEGGCDDEGGLAENENAFARLRFVPRCLVDVSRRDQGRPLLGHRFASAFGIAPTGLIGLFRHQGDRLLIQAAAEANVPFVLSGAGTASFQDVQQLWPEAWTQLYISRDESIWRRQLARAEDAGLRTLVVTVDVPASSKRERNARRGWSLSASTLPSITMIADALRHPAWTYAFLRHGFPFLEAWRDFARENATSREVAAIFAAQCPAPQDWRLLGQIRTAWKGNLVLKGILSPDDAKRAIEHGSNAVMVSNHGGRQLDRAVAPIDMLPSIVDVAGGRVPVLIDSGIRRGADIVASRALGADMAFVGRATLYGLVAGGLDGARRAIAILREETDLCMAQVGLTSLDGVSASILHRCSPCHP